jgi:hypothetical protein
LLGQLVHHFRADLAGVPGLGPPLVSAYALVGVELAPGFDLAQYEILDSAAAARGTSGQRGWLIIETRLRNTGPRVQPYPYIFVRLEDRWQETIAGRYFAPEEYLESQVGDPSRMSVGRTVDAQFVLLDPGPDASGFEVDVCMRRPEGFTCKEDAVFE